MIYILIGVLGAIAAAIIGTFWYSMSTPMGRIHMESIGFLKLSEAERAQKIAEAKPHMWKSYLLQMLLSFLTSVFIGYVVSKVGNDAYMYIGGIWLAFVVPNIGSALLWGNVDRKIVWQKFFSDSFSALITFLAVCFIANLIL